MELVYLVITELEHCMPQIESVCASFTLADKMAHQIVAKLDPPYKSKLWIHQEFKCGDTLTICIWVTDSHYKESPFATIKVIAKPVMC